MPAARPGPTGGCPNVALRRRLKLRSLLVLFAWCISTAIVLSPTWTAEVGIGIVTGVISSFRLEMPVSGRVE